MTNVDDAHLAKLSAATKNDVYLSDRSPLGLPFWSLRTSASEESRQQLIDANRPGSPCPKGFLVSDTEFTNVPICPASRVYQKRKLKQIETLEIPIKSLGVSKNKVLAKSCLCRDLAGSATIKHGIDNEVPPAVCCGPNIVNFSKIATLEEMVSHIYGQLSLLTDPDRPHMFIRELSLYVDVLREEIEKASEGLMCSTAKCFEEFKSNLNDGIEYYQSLAEQFGHEQKEKFMNDLDALFEELEKVLPEPDEVVPLGVIS